MCPALLQLFLLMLMWKLDESPLRDNSGRREQGGVMRTAISLLRERDHPLRRSLVDELHIRRFPPFAAPLCMTQVVTFTGYSSPAEVRKHAEALGVEFGLEQPIEGRYACVELGNIWFVWECHGE